MRLTLLEILIAGEGNRVSGCKAFYILSRHFADHFQCIDLSNLFRKITFKREQNLFMDIEPYQQTIMLATGTKRSQMKKAITPLKSELKPKKWFFVVALRSCTE